MSRRRTSSRSHPTAGHVRRTSGPAGAWPGLRAVAVGAATAVVATVVAVPGHAAVAAPVVHAADDARLQLVPVGTYASGLFDESAAEIVAFHGATGRLFVVNAAQATVDVLDASTPTSPEKLHELRVVGTPSSDGSAVPAGAVANSVAVRADGLVVVAVESDTKTGEGWLVFFDAAAPGAALGAVRVGAQPDMVALSDDGHVAVSANEGEPDETYAVDPEGSVSVVTLPTAVAAPGQDDVRTAGFHAFEAGGTLPLPEGVRVFAGLATPGPHPVSENLEPEYVTIEGATAYVTLQEANAVATVDLPTATVTGFLPLGSKDHGAPGNGLDPSDRDGVVDIRTVPGLRGLFMPDAIASYTSGGETYLVTANEGDAREWGEYVEPARVEDLGSDGLPPLCADSPFAAMTGETDLGRLNVSTADGLVDGEDGPCYGSLAAFGARSFSIWSTDGTQVFDSGDELERVTADALPGHFNASNTNTDLDNRSDDKGPEPEAVAIGDVNGRTYAFIGLERIGGVAVYDVTAPRSASFVTYVNNRDLTLDPEDPAAGDSGPESIAFIPAADSPTGRPMIAVGNEVSGTTTLYAVADPGPAPGAGRDFADVVPGQAFYEEIRWLADHGLAEGTTVEGTTSFLPASPMSRQAMAAFLHRYAGAGDEPAPGVQTFSDVPPGHPFHAAVEWMASKGLAEGYADGTFGATRPVSRQATAAFLHRLAGEPGPTEATDFTDVRAGDEFAPAIAWLAEVGITQGYDDGSFRPTDPVTRQATAAFLHRYHRFTAEVPAAG